MTGLSALGPQAAAAAQQGSGTGRSTSTDMPAPVRSIVRAAYGDATGRIFLIAAIVAVVALVAVLFVKEVPLRMTVSQEASSPAAVEQAVAGAVGASAPVVAQAALPLEGPAVEEPAVPALTPAEAEAAAVREERRTGRPSARRDTPIVLAYDARSAGSSPARRDAVAAGRHRYPRRRD